MSAADSVCPAVPELTIEVPEAHADGDHQRQDDASVQAAAELALVLLLAGRLHLGRARGWPLGLTARHPAFPGAPLAHRGAALAAAVIAAGLGCAALRGKHWKATYDI